MDSSHKISGSEGLSIGKTPKTKLSRDLSRGTVYQRTFHALRP